MSPTQAARDLAALLGIPLPTHAPAASPADPATTRRLAEALRRVPPRSFQPHPWAKLTDQEWAALRPWLTGGDRKRRGRPPQNLRRTADAIFWVAASTGPWRELPAELGKPGSAHQALRRWAKSSTLYWLVLGCCLPDSKVSPLLKRLAWFVCRAFRRMGRLLPFASLRQMERHGFKDALPQWPLQVPDRNLSKTTSLLVRGAIQEIASGGLEALQAARDAVGSCLGVIRQAQTSLRAWRLR